MASSSSGSSASPDPDFDKFLDSLASILSEGSSTPINLDNIYEGQLCDGMNANILPHQVGQSQDGFLDFGSRIDNFRLGTEFLAEQTAESSLDPLNFDLIFGHSELMPVSSGFTITGFTGLESVNNNSLTGADSFPNGGLNWNVPINSLPAVGDVHSALVGEGARNTVEGNASQQPMNVAVPVSPSPQQKSSQSDPARTPPQATAASSSNSENSHGSRGNMDIDASPEGAPLEVLEEGEAGMNTSIGASPEAPKPRRSTRRRTATIRAVQSLRQDGIRKTRKQATKNAVSEARKTTRAEKSKHMPQQDTWQVVVLQNREVGAGEISSDSGSGNAPTLDGSTRESTLPSTSKADLGTASVRRRPRRRKDVFQLVEPAKPDKRRPEWPAPAARSSLSSDPTSDEQQLSDDQSTSDDQTITYVQPARRNFLPPGPHSKRGWVLARLREPDSDRPRYGWSIGQIHDPRKQAYLILSGPHRAQVKTVREYDRIEYSPENVQKLREVGQDKKQGGRPETVYDVVTVGAAELLQLSSVYAVLHASSMSIRLGID